MAVKEPIAPPTLPRLLSAGEVAQVLGAHPNTVRSLLREGDIPSLRVAGHYRVPPETLAQWIATNTTRRAAR